MYIMFVFKCPSNRLLQISQPNVDAHQTLHGDQAFIREDGAVVGDMLPHQGDKIGADLTVVDDRPLHLREVIDVV